MVKILHTSDWHLGHALYNYDRFEEQSAMIGQIVGIVEKELPDLFLLCGDVYHTPQPSAAIQKLFADAMVRIHKANSNMKIVVTAGNHDSGSKHDIFQSPWLALNVHTIGSIDKERLETHLIEIPNKCIVVALPYCHTRNLPDGFFQQVLDLATQRNTDNLPIVMMAHTTVHGCDFSGHENISDYTVGGIDKIDLQEIGTGYDYLALGHIHHAQFIHNKYHNVRYSGTPLAVNFDENYNHSVSIVEIAHHGETPNVRTIEITNPHPLVTLPSNDFTSWEEAKKMLANFPNDIAAYIRLNVTVDQFLPSQAQAEAITLTQGKQCRFCHINVKREKLNKSNERTLTVQEFQKEAPIDIAQRYADDCNIEFDNELKELFQQTLEQIQLEVQQ